MFVSGIPAPYVCVSVPCMKDSLTSLHAQNAHDFQLICVLSRFLTHCMTWVFPDMHAAIVLFSLHFSGDISQCISVSVLI